MAALVQTYPQQSGTVTMLQTRPTSASAQSSQPYGSQQRGSFYGANNGVGGPTTYRGGSAPIQPYAFTSTPSLTPAAQWQQFRASSASAVPTVHTMDHGNRARYPASASMTNLPSSSGMGYTTSGARDDSALTGVRRVNATPRPQSAYLTGSTGAMATQVSFAQATPVKISPERYRRPAPRIVDVSNPGQQTRPVASAQPSGSGMATVGHLYNVEDQKSNMPRGTLNRPNSFYAQVPAGAAADDMQLYRHNAHEEAKRFRRRSMPALDAADYLNLQPPHSTSSNTSKQPEESSRPQHSRTKSADKQQKSVRMSNTGTGNARNGSAESLVSSRSSNSRPSSGPSSSANRATSVTSPTGNPALVSSPTEQQNASTPQDYPKVVTIPARGSSSDATSKGTASSPLSKPVSMETEAAKASVPPTRNASSPLAQSTSSQANEAQSPAVKQLAAISAKGGKLKSKTSRLRRAFSFGSAAELRKAAGEDSENAANGGITPSKLHKEPTAEELYETEQARIAQKQEEGGIGNSIYAGARIFSGSTDNLSISSTASSASIMIRKMGRGMKKGGRSLVGLFRPKSVIGVPAADGPIMETSLPAVSMVTVEAERELVNVNADPHTHTGGGTGYPRLERNSIDASKDVAERLGSSGTDNSGARKSIVGGERERAEVLAAVKKGILKKNRTGSPSNSPAFELPQVPNVSDSPFSSAPSTPNDDAQGHKRSGSVAIGTEDYFMTALRLRQDTKSAPNTPHGSHTPGHGSLKRNATFSPRIVFYDTWPSQEYDRRGEIATCNRLTPMLAQQIKEELNSFKMEMEVHENSKIYTHFF